MILWGNSTACNADLFGSNPGLDKMDKENHTVLHLACLNGHEEVAKYLCVVALIWKHGRINIVK